MTDASQQAMTDTTNESDPFHPDNLPIVNFIMQARIYDALIALLKETNPDTARDLLELHASGTLVGSAPSFNGVFVTDEMNTDE